MTDRVVIDTNRFKVSKPGVNVLSAAATSPDNLLLSEDTQNLGVFMTGQATLTANAAYSGSRNYIGQTIMFPSDLGYIPYVMTHWQLLADEAFTPPANSESWRYPDPDLVEGDYYAYYVYPFSDRLRLWKWGTLSFNIRYTVFYANAGVI